MSVASSARWRARPHDIVLAVAVLVALPTALRGGRDQWFHLDEWSFLAGRSLTDVGGLLEAHNGHWVTIPAIIYRLNFALFGLHTYLPYQLLVIASHLAIAVLIQRVAIRLGVNGWLATTGAIVFMFFGSGVRNIVFAFQISLNGSVAIGLVLTLLAVRPADRRRDLVMITLAVVGLMTSGVMVAMVAGVFVVILCTRGLRAAVTFVIPPATVFLVWYLLAGGSDTERGTFGQTVEFVWRMATATFEQLGTSPVVAVAFAGLAVTGCAAAAHQAYRTREMGAAAIPAGLVVAWLLFAGSAAVSRAAILPFLPDAPEASRYTHVGAALFLPLVLLGAETIRRSRPKLLLPLVVLLLLGVPTNIDRLLDPSPAGFGRKNLVLAVAHSDLAEDAPRDVAPIVGPGFFRSEVTVGWLLDARADGRLPDAGDLSRAVRLEADGRIALEAVTPAALPCAVPEPVGTVDLDEGDVITFAAPSVTARVRSDGAESPPLPFGGSEQSTTIRVVAGPIRVDFQGPGGEDVPACIERSAPADPQMP